MTTANIITIIRVLLIPVFMLLALIEGPVLTMCAFFVFILASATDGVDGYIARKYNQVTTLGKFLDPLADKLLITAALLIFVQNGTMGAVAAMLIITREFAVTGLRIVAMGEGIVIAAQLSGKIKTFIQIVGSAFLLTPLAQIEIAKISLGSIVGWIMVIVTVISGIAYFKGFGEVFSDLESIGDGIGVTIRCQRAEIFEKMHRI